MRSWQRIFQKSLYPVLAAGFFSLFPNIASAVDFGNVNMTGYYLAVANTIHQDNRTVTDARRKQFDMALNLGLKWQVNPRVTALADLRGGTGNSSIGLSGQNISVSDLVLILNVNETPNVTLTIGSYTVPFGEESNNTTVNAYTLGNSFLLNSLFYGSWGGHTGSLNTVGLMGKLATKRFDWSCSLSNGTGSSSTNPDGEFEFVVAMGTNPLKDLRLGAAWLTSDDTSISGNDGFNAEVKGWIVEGNYGMFDRVRIKGYAGEMQYGDKNPATRDDVKIWSGEARHDFKRFYLAGQLSGWKPEDRNGNGVGMSAALPNPGLATTLGGVAVVTDQKVRRTQIGVGFTVFDDLLLKLSWFRDDYDRTSANRSTDAAGVFLALNGKL